MCITSVIKGRFPYGTDTVVGGKKKKDLTIILVVTQCRHLMRSPDRSREGTLKLALSATYSPRVSSSSIVI